MALYLMGWIRAWKTGQTCSAFHSGLDTHAIFSAWVLGPQPGSRFCLKPVLQVGGVDEYDLIEAKKKGRITKPVVAWCVGTCASCFTTEAGTRRTDAHNHLENWGWVIFQSSLLGWAPPAGTPKITQNTAFPRPYQNNHKQTTPLQRENGAPQKEIRPKVVSPFWAPCSAGAVVSVNSCLERAIPWKATVKGPGCFMLAGKIFF